VYDIRLGAIAGLDAGAVSKASGLRAYAHSRRYPTPDETTLTADLVVDASGREP
jgi:hypothetical protein